MSIRTLYGTGYTLLHRQGYIFIREASLQLGRETYLWADYRKVVYGEWLSKGSMYNVLKNYLLMIE
ncbi:hypothetical protein D3C73_889340 [compost metagenome]